MGGDICVRGNLPRLVFGEITWMISSLHTWAALEDFHEIWSLRRRWELLVGRYNTGLHIRLWKKAYLLEKLGRRRDHHDH